MTRRIETRRFNGNDESGFTLVELLVVIAIISVLAAMLLPALDAARRSAWRADCMGRCRSAGQIFLLYADGADGVLPARETTYDVVVGSDFRTTMAEYNYTVHLAFSPDQPATYPGETTIEWWFQQHGGLTGIVPYMHCMQSGNDTTRPRGPQRVTDGEDASGRPRVLLADVNRYRSGNLSQPWIINHGNPDDTSLSRTTFTGQTVTTYVADGIHTTHLDLSTTWIMNSRLDTTVACDVGGDLNYWWTE